MSKSVRSILSFILVLQLIIPYSTFAAAVGKFTSVDGNVMQKRAKKTIKSKAKSSVQQKDIIITGPASSTTMIFSDDSMITLSENTKLEIKEFLIKGKSRRGVFTLLNGKLLVNVKKNINGNNIFEIRSSKAIAAVKGTFFEFELLERVNVKEGEMVATIYCSEGKLEIISLSPDGTTASTETIVAGQSAVVSEGNVVIKDGNAFVSTERGLFDPFTGEIMTGTIGTPSEQISVPGADTSTPKPASQDQVNADAVNNLRIQSEMPRTDTQGQDSAAAAIGTTIAPAYLIGGAVTAGVAIGALALGSGGGGGGGSSSGGGGGSTTEQSLAGTWKVAGEQHCSTGTVSTWSETQIWSPGGSVAISETVTVPGTGFSTSYSGTGMWTFYGSTVTFKYNDETRGWVFTGSAQANSKTFSVSITNICVSTVNYTKM